MFLTREAYNFRLALMKPPTPPRLFKRCPLISLYHYNLDLQAWKAVYTSKVEICVFCVKVVRTATPFLTVIFVRLLCF